VELYGIDFMAMVEPKIVELDRTGGDPKDILLLKLALAAYIMDTDRRVEMTITLHPDDKAVIEREAEARKTNSSDLMTMATLHDIKTRPRKSTAQS